MLRTEEINDIHELSPLRAAWAKLLRGTAGATFFHSLEWLEVYWSHWSAEQRLRVITVSDGNELAAIVPFVVRPEMTRVGRVRFLTYPLDYWGSFYGPIGRDPQSALDAALRHVHRSHRDWDAVELRWIAEPDVPQVSGAMRLVGFRPEVGARDHSALIDLASGWESYFRSRSSKWRNNYRRDKKAVLESGQVEYVRYRPSENPQLDPRWDLYDECVQVARSSWQANSPDGTTMSHDSVSDFLRAAHLTAAQRGCVDLNLLRLDGAPVAFAYNYVLEGHISGLRAGFDAQQAPSGAGSYLIAQAIQDSCQRGDEVYDLGPGHLRSKRYLHTEVRTTYRCGYFPWYSLRSQLLRAKRRYDRLFEQAV